jgi:hypothetical protein
LGRFRVNAGVEPPGVPMVPEEGFRGNLRKTCTVDLEMKILLRSICILAFFRERLFFELALTLPNPIFFCRIVVPSRLPFLHPCDKLCFVMTFVEQKLRKSAVLLRF